MHTAKTQQHQTQNRQAVMQSSSAALAVSPGGTVAQREAMMASAPQAVRLARLSAMIDASPVMAAQRRVADMVRASPRHTGKVVQGEFKDSAELREDTFVAKAMDLGLTREKAIALYEKSGGSAPDPVTGLRTATDKEESRTLARNYAAQGALGTHNDVVYYANIKFYNLAGLNAAKGHAGADAIFGLMAQCVDQALDPLRGAHKVQGYRHEGSRFGFMIVGDKDALDASLIETELERAKTSWSAGKAGLGIADIANPKHPQQKGVDLGYTVVEIEANRGGQQAAQADENEAAQTPADAGIAPLVKHASQGAAPGIFKGQAQERTETFYASADKLGLDGKQAETLYKIAGRSEKEPLTGFDAAGDRLGTLEKAMELHHAQWPNVFAGYIEVDVRNLGGLNDNLTRGDSDNVFKFMSDTTDKHVRSLKADVVSFRHGGDEFSFVVVAKFPAVQGEDVRTVLGEAETAVGAYVENKKVWQKEKTSFTVDALTGLEVSQLNNHILPTVFEAPFEKEAAMRSKPVIETNTQNELWRLIGGETYWLISHAGGKFKVINIPRQLTLNQILHSKNTAEKPRLPGTGIVWGESTVFKEDTSPVDAIARADQEVELKKE